MQLLLINLEKDALTSYNDACKMHFFFTNDSVELQSSYYEIIHEALASLLIVAELKAG